MGKEVMTATHARNRHTLTHLHTNINIFMLATRGNNGKDRMRTLAMMGRMSRSRQEVSWEEEGVTFHILSF